MSAPVAPEAAGLRKLAERLAKWGEPPAVLDAAAARLERLAAALEAERERVRHLEADRERAEASIAQGLETCAARLEAINDLHEQVRQRDEQIAALTAERDALRREVEQWRES